MLPVGPVCTMTRKSDIRRTVLQGIYEDNAGIPRSHTGKRRQPAPPPPEPPRRRQGARVYGMAGMLTLLVIVGLTVRDIGQVDFSSEVSATTAGTDTLMDAGQLTRDPRIQPAMPARQASRPAGAPEKGIDMVPLATSGQYDLMLDQLGMPVAELFDLTVQTIVIDPGHGGSDPGAIGHQGLMEKDVALDIARRLQQRLMASGRYRVILTRDDDSKMQLKERVAFTRQNGADLFISIHINSVPREAGPVNYVETYYFGPHQDQQTLELARKENENSEYAMGDFRQVIARIGDTLKTEESAQLATSIHQHLYTNLRRHNTDLLDAGAKTGPFVVLLGVEVPSVLVEVSCISNEAEADRLASPGYRENIASYLQTGIVEYLETRNQNTPSDGVNSKYVAN